MGSTTLPEESRSGEVMMWRRTFAGLPEQACHARDFVRFLLEGHSRCDDAVDVVAELSCNAIAHTNSRRLGGTFCVELRRWKGCCVTLSVIDGGGDSEPVVSEAPPVDLEDLESLAEGGRGLAIVGELADYWGWTGDVNGRTVTAIFI